MEAQRKYIWFLDKLQDSISKANCDTGASTETMSLDAGGTIVDTLKENKQLGWTFVDEKQAKEFKDILNTYISNVLPYFEIIR